MSDYYSKGFGSTTRSRDKRNRKELALLATDLAVMVVMAILIFLSLTAIICQYVNPEKSGVMSVLALAAPIIYLLDLVVMFYWVVRLRWYCALAMLLVVLLGLCYLSKYYRIDFDRDYATKFVERKYTKVMTYNVHEGKDEHFVEYIDKHNPDILCLQEINVYTENWRALEERYKTTLIREASSGNQILTKYKIVRKGLIEDLHPLNAVWADLKIKEDTIRVISLHLKSTAIRLEDTQFLENHMYIVDSERDTKLKSIVSRLVENNQKRAVQAKKVAEFKAQSPYKVIVCGDFNDVPLSYTYRTIAKDLDDTFSEMAKGFAYTFNTRYNLLRIDNILVSPSIEVASYEVDNNVEMSDHFPVISRLIIKK